MQYNSKPDTEHVRCPICNTICSVKTYYEEPAGVTEQYIMCPHKHYGSEFSYGHLEIYVGKQRFNLNYDTKREDRERIDKHLKDAIRHYLVTHKGELLEIWIGSE